MTSIELMTEKDMERALKRIAHEIIEGNEGTDRLALIGIKRRGVPLARRISDYIGSFENADIPVGLLDITLYRDDLSQINPQPTLNATEISFSVDEMHIVMVDDVIYTGRTARAGMDAIMDIGRPATIRLAVLIDRGHRELPIRADYVGKNVPTAKAERISVRINEIDGENNVALIR